jgi:dihydroorotate dehydrogenase
MGYNRLATMSKQDLPFRTPYLNAAGTLGFAPNPRGGVDIARLGGFFTHPVSLAPRAPAERRAVVPFAGGVLLHTGLPNPGLNAVLARYAARWAASSLPVVVHLLANTPAEA